MKECIYHQAGLTLAAQRALSWLGMGPSELRLIVAVVCHVAQVYGPRWVTNRRRVPLVHAEIRDSARSEVSVSAVGAVVPDEPVTRRVHGHGKIAF